MANILNNHDLGMQGAFNWQYHQFPRQSWGRYFPDSPGTCCKMWPDAMSWYHNDCESCQWTGGNGKTATENCGLQQVSLCELTTHLAVADNTLQTISCVHYLTYNPGLIFFGTICSLLPFHFKDAHFKNIHKKIGILSNEKDFAAFFFTKIHWGKNILGGYRNLKKLPVKL